MALARGVGKKIAYRRETIWGEVPTVLTGARYLPRVTGSFNVTAEALQSATVRTDYQIEDYRLGMRSGEGSLNTELSPGTIEEFMGAVVARDFTTGGVTASTSLTIGTVGVFNTVTRSTGSWLTDGYFVGNIVRLGGAALNAANKDTNLLVVGITATVLTVKTLNDNVLVNEGPIATSTASAVGKQTFAPQTGHISPSFTIEEFYSDIAISEAHTGMKVGSLAVQLPTNGFCTSDVSFMGKGKTKNSTSQLFISPIASPTNGLTVAVSGAVLVNGVPAGVITAADFSIDRGLEPANTIGQNSAVEIFDGRVNVTGNFSTYFENGTFRDYFLNETKISLIIALSTGSEKNANVLSFTFPSIKLGGSSRSDAAEGGMIQDHPFQALLNTNVAGGMINSTLLIQDTSLV